MQAGPKRGFQAGPRQNMEESYILLPPSDEFLGKLLHDFFNPRCEMLFLFPGGDSNSGLASSIMQSCISQKMEQVAKIKEYSSGARAVSGPISRDMFEAIAKAIDQ